MIRTVWLFGLTLCAILTPTRSMAQDAELAGWSVQNKDGVLTYSSPDTSTMIIILDSSPSANTPDLDQLAAGFKDGMAKPELCPTLKSAPLLPIMNGQGRKAVSSGDGATRCSLIIGRTSDKVVITFGLQTIASTIPLSSKLEVIANRRLGFGSQVVARPPAKPTPSEGTGDAQLRAALASVPVANRPIAMVGRQTGSSSGGFTYFVSMPWMIFANGYATDAQCFDWDPRYVTPTPAALKGPPHRCSLERWRKSGSVYEFQDENGKWEREANPMRVYPFKPGQRLDRNLKSISGAGSGAPVAGMISVNTVFRGGLKLTNAGLIYSDWSNDTGISGGGVGGGASGRGVNMQGRYYLDGHLIAATDPTGKIKIGFIGGAHDEGDVPFTYLYMNGKQFSPIRADD